MTQTKWPPGNPARFTLLSGLLFGRYGPLLREAGISRGKVYRYYGPPKRLRKGVPKRDNGRFRAAELEQVILAQIDPEGCLGQEAASAKEAAELAGSLVERIDLGENIAIRLKTGRTINVPLAPWLATGRLLRRSITATTVTAVSPFFKHPCLRTFSTPY